MTRLAMLPVSVTGFRGLELELLVVVVAEESNVTTGALMQTSEPC